MRIQAVTGIVLIALLFVSALMETNLLDKAADRLFFDHHSSAAQKPIAADAAMLDKQSAVSQLTTSAPEIQSTV